MRFRYVMLVAVVTAIYGVAAYFVLAYLPSAIALPRAVVALANASAKAQLVMDSETSIRSGGVTLLTGSTLGALGLAAFLTFGAGRRDAERIARKSQDELFTRSLEMIGSADPSVAAGAASLVGSLAQTRVDLRSAASAALFSVVRQQVRLSDTTSGFRVDGDIGLLADRNTLAAAALKALGQLPGFFERETGGRVLERRLSGCDLRGWQIAGARYELVTFATSFLCDSSFVDCEFVKCVFGQVDWTGATLRRVRFVECDLEFTNLEAAHGFEVKAERCLGTDSANAPLWLATAQ
jgi:Pentapeptide repeats (9 copies)